MENWFKFAKGEPSNKIRVYRTAGGCLSTDTEYVLPERKHNYFFADLTPSGWFVELLSNGGNIIRIPVPKEIKDPGLYGLYDFINELMEQYASIPYNKENGIRSFYCPVFPNGLTASKLRQMQELEDPVRWYVMNLDGTLVEIGEETFLKSLSASLRKLYYQERTKPFQCLAYMVRDEKRNEFIVMAAKAVWYCSIDGKRTYYRTVMDAMECYMKHLPLKEEEFIKDLNVGVLLEGVHLDLVKQVEHKVCLLTDFLKPDYLHNNHALSVGLNELLNSDCLDAVIIADDSLFGKRFRLIDVKDWDNTYSVKGIPGLDNEDEFFTSISDTMEALRFQNYYMLYCKNHVTGFIILYDANYRQIFECETYSRSELTRVFAKHGLEKLITEYPQRMEAIDLVERIRQSGARKHCDKTDALDSANKEEQNPMKEDTPRDQPHKFAVFEVTRCVRQPDYYGGDSYDYCIEHSLFHPAFHKGDLVYVPYAVITKLLEVESEEELKQSVGNKSRMCSTNAFSKKDLVHVYQARLKDKDMADRRQKPLSLESTLYEVWNEISRRGFSRPSSEDLRFHGYMDGDMLFTEFVQRKER